VILFTIPVNVIVVRGPTMDNQVEGNSGGSGDESVQSKLQDIYFEERQLLRTQAFEADRDVDKYTFAASGTALALSFTFLKDLVPLNVAIYPSILFAAWVSMVVGVVASLVSLHRGAEAFRSQLDTWDDAAAEGLTPEFLTRAYDKRAQCKETFSSRTLVWIAIATTTAGIILLIAFVGINVTTKGLANVRQETGKTQPASTPSGINTPSETCTPH
jgi:hypothetical protein